MKVAIIGGGGTTAPMRIALALAALGRSVRFVQPSAMGKSERNPQMEIYAEAMQHAGPLTIDELRAALPPNDDPFKPCRRSKGEKARNRKQRGGYR